MTRCVLAIDQGTTSTRALLFDARTNVIGIAAQEFHQYFPRSGWVEHDPSDIWSTVVQTSRHALESARLSARDIAAIGITNQRETVVVWERTSGKPIYNAIVWQDRRTSNQCAQLKAKGHEPDVMARTGLPLDPYFSATKLNWILDHVEGAREKAEAGDLAAGTIDTFLLWKLTDGRVHASDATNASRTALYNIHKEDWDDDLLDLFRVPKSILPEVKDCAADFGVTNSDILGAPVPIRGVAGDQQAASIGQACFTSGMLKSTYGTGCFALLNTGETPVRSKNGLLTTIASRLNGETNYALEGSIYVAGAGVQWLRDALQVLPSSDQADAMARAADENQNVVLVPAFVGLGAPYWDSECRGAIFGLNRNSGPNELVKATLEAVCLQTVDLLDAMKKDWPSLDETVLRVDGGMSASNWTMQRLADLTGCPVERPVCLETTALGAAYVAGLEGGFFPPPETFSDRWSRERRFTSEMDVEERELILSRWHDAVARTLSRPITV